MEVNTFARVFYEYKNIIFRTSVTNLQVICTEEEVKPIESNSDEVEERTKNFSKTPEIPTFLRTSETTKTPESVEKILFSKTPPSEM